MLNFQFNPNLSTLLTRDIRETSHRDFDETLFISKYIINNQYLQNISGIHLNHTNNPCPINVTITEFIAIHNFILKIKKSLMALLLL